MNEKIESVEEKAMRVKGWCIKNGEPCVQNNNIILKEILSLSEYMDFVVSLDSTKQNPVFYRGHFNANYIPIPSIMRSGIEHEDTMIKEFSRRFPSEVAERKTTMEKIALMQHFGLCTRAMDVSESPLIALAFACNHYPFITAKERDGLWGEVVLFQEKNQSENHKTADIKYTESLTTSIIANCSQCEQEFYLGLLRIHYLQDGHHGHEQNFIKFRDIVSQSVIVRTPLSNERQRNQRGAYILCNANEISKITKANSRTISVSIDTEKLTRRILTPEYDMFSLGDMNQFEEYEILKDSEEWDFKFRKITPYSLENKIEHFQKDPFSLEHLHYTNNEGKRYAVVVSPTNKMKISRELEKIGIDNFFLYPEMYNVSHEINEIYTKNIIVKEEK